MNIGGGRPDASDVKALLRGRDVVGITESLDADADAGFEVVDQLKLEVLSKCQRFWKRFVAFTLVVMWTRSQFGGISAFAREWANFCPKKKRVKGKSAMVEDAEDDEEVEEV